mmetsp:Transcript_70273/g.121780  ORF Transcript_70273/g.121780 Transcript_70273/m.121780 type:complete len:284 (+) Transcript_70273:101-952(+)
MPSTSGQVPASQAEDKGVISQLQEFIQGSKDWKAPAGRPVLDWVFDERKDKAGASEFRATVTFVLDGVPHHVAGEWYSAKNQTKRDLAERVLRLYVTTWGEQLLEGRSQRAVQSQRYGSATQAGKTAKQDAEKQVKEIEEFLRASQSSGDAAPRWSFSWSLGENECQAIVEVTLHGVAHKFIGKKEKNEDAAKLDTAKRTAWYLQCPGYEEEFDIDPAARATTIPPPPANWIHGMTDQNSAKAGASAIKSGRGPQETADRKSSGGRFARNANRNYRAAGAAKH